MMGEMATIPISPRTGREALPPAPRAEGEDTTANKVPSSGEVTISHVRRARRGALSGRLAAALVGAVVMLMTGCASDAADEDGYLPPYVRELCELISDHEGRAKYVRFADGREVPVLNNVDELTPDSLYRINTNIIEREGGVELYGATLVFSPLPVIYRAEDIRRDPVGVVTAWREPRYVNLRLAVPRGNEASHYLAFVKEQLITHPDGRRTLCITLHHDQNGDGAYYTGDLIVSCPVYHLDDQLRHDVDSISMTVATPAGPYVYTTVY